MMDRRARTTRGVAGARPGCVRRTRRALTLLEVIIALSLTGVLLSGVYLFYSNTLRAREIADRLVADAQLSRITLARIADDLRNAGGYTPGFGVGVTGEIDKWGNGVVKIYRQVLPENDCYAEYDLLTDVLPPAKADVRLIEYRLIVDEENKDENGEPLVHGLFRSEQKTLLQWVVMQTEGSDSMPDSALDEGGGEGDMGADAGPSGIEGELMAPEIKYLKFSFFDGRDWTDQWVGMDNQGNALPQAVRITIGRYPLTEEERAMEESIISQLDDEKRREIEYEHPDRVSMIVRLKQADRFLNSRLANAKNQFGDMKSELRDQSEDFKRELRSTGGGLGRQGR